MSTVIIGLSILLSIFQAVPNPSIVYWRKYKRDAALEHAILCHYQLKHQGAPDNTVYTSSYVNLNNDKQQEVLVYIWGDCGTGGCSLLIARRYRSGYRIISEIDPVRLPVMVSNRKHHGWRNIITLEGGTANDAPFNVEYRFDGKSYTDKLSRVLIGKPRGRTLISGKLTAHDGIPLQNLTTGQKMTVNCGNN